MGHLIDIFRATKPLKFFFIKYYYLNKLEQDVEPATKALAVSEPMAIFYPRDGKSWLAGSTIVVKFKYYNTN